MTAEEKAKAYDEVREKIALRFGSNVAEEIFSEFEESENERIRKIIKNSLQFYFDGKLSEGTNDTDYAMCLAWVEKQGDKGKLTHEDICKAYNIPDIGEFSDGYHTFNGLYKQRMILFAVLVKTYKDRAWKSWKHEDGLDCFGGGWFIVGIDTPDGTYTYHYEAKDWDRFDCQVLEKAKHWDGHDEFDVERLFSLVSNDNKIEVLEKQEHPINYREAEKACLEYRKFREDCGIKDPVMLDEIEDAYYNWATSIQKPAWSEEDEEELGIAIKYLQQAGQWDSATWLKSLKERLSKR